MRLPTSWGQITINQYLALKDCYEPGQDAIEQQIRILSILTGKPDHEIEALPIDRFKAMVTQVAFIEKLPEMKVLPKTVTINGVRHLVNLKVTDLTGGQYIDLMTLTRDKDKVTENMASILAVFVTPMQKKWWRWKKAPYDGLKHREVAANIGKHLTMDIAYPVAVFFCKLLQNSMDAIKEYSIKQAEVGILKARMMIREAMDTSSIGDGS